MRRRDFLYYLSSVMTAAGARAHEPSGSAVDPGWRTFEITTSVTITEPAGHTLLWLPLPSKVPTDYQRVLATNWSVPPGGSAELVTAPGYDVSMLHVEWADPK